MLLEIKSHQQYKSIKYIYSNLKTLLFHCRLSFLVLDILYPSYIYIALQNCTTMLLRRLVVRKAIRTRLRVGSEEQSKATAHQLSRGWCRALPKNRQSIYLCMNKVHAKSKARALQLHILVGVGIF